MMIHSEVEQMEFVMTHTRFATVPSRDGHAEGWTRALESLAEFLEQQHRAASKPDLSKPLSTRRSTETEHH